MKIGIKLTVEDRSSAAFEYIEDAEYIFRDDKPKLVDVFIFTKNPISNDRKIIRGRSMIKYNDDISDIQIIEDDGREYNYVYLLPGKWLFDVYNNIIEYGNEDLNIVKDYLSKYDL